MTAILSPDGVSLVMSEKIDQLAIALCAMQAVLVNVKKDKSGQVGNQKTKYADLAGVWDGIREPLTKNGLCVVQPLLPTSEPNRVGVRTYLLHKSGQWIYGDLYLTATQATPQGIGSCITYARRYSLGSVLGVCTELDDDGEEASRKAHARGQVSDKAGKGQQPPDAREAAFKRLSGDLQRGFKGWAEKLAWAEANRAAKLALPDPQQKQLSAQYVAAEPKGSKPPEGFDTSPAPQTNADGELLDADGIPL